MKTATDEIAHLSPCCEAMGWARGYPSLAEAWAVCPRGDWMLWLAGKFAGEPWSKGRKRLVLAACECARLSLPYTQDVRVLRCIETAERWARGEATREELIEARQRALTSASAYAASAATAAATAAAATAAAAASAYAASASAASASAASARDKVLAECADIVRRHYPEPPK